MISDYVHYVTKKNQWNKYNLNLSQKGKLLLSNSLPVNGGASLFSCHRHVQIWYSYSFMSIFLLPHSSPANWEKSCSFCRMIIQTLEKISLFFCTCLTVERDAAIHTGRVIKQEQNWAQLLLFSSSSSFRLQSCEGQYMYLHGSCMPWMYVLHILREHNGIVICGDIIKLCMLKDWSKVLQLVCEIIFRHWLSNFFFLN